MSLFAEYQRLNLDTASISLEARDTTSGYFCAPVGAIVFGWAGVDGIHYCFVPGFGEMVFAVEPMAEPGRYVHPLASSFEDFLRLILACGDAALPQQFYLLEDAQCQALLRENPPSKKQRAVLTKLQKALHLTPMEHPCRYVKELQASFDYSSLPFSEAYYRLTEKEAGVSSGPWQVSFSGGFWGRDRRETPGQEIPLHAEFDWGGQHWRVPSIYPCGKGLVIDLCAEVDPEQIRSFLEKWLPSAQHEEALTEDEREYAMAENPLSIHLRPQAMLNNKPLLQYHSCCTSWNPCLSDERSSNTAAKAIVAHYGLDPAKGWGFSRISFPWATVHRPKLNSLALTLAREPIALPGAHFTVKMSGQQISFTHPVTGVLHTLTVGAYKQETVSPEQLPNDWAEWPSHYTVLSYTLSPDLPCDAFSVRDTAQSDEPRPKQADLNPAHAAIGIIGGADGPTAFCLTTPDEEGRHAVCSSLHFAPTDAVEWRISFYHKPVEDITIKLI